MPRPKRKRVIAHPPVMEGFRPFGIPTWNLDPVSLRMEEFEAFRLVDFIGLNHAGAAREMGVSRPTLTRIYDQARRTIATAFALGKAIIIEGGDFTMKEDLLDIPGFCICPFCDMRIRHEPGRPCREDRCPSCGKKMVREGSYHHQLIIKKKGEKNE